MTTKTKIIIGVVIAILLALTIFFIIKYYKDQNEALLLELNSKGEYVKLSDSLHAYTGFISSKFDSVLKANKDLLDEIKRNKEKPELVTVYKTNTIIREIPVITYVDSSKADSRIADYKDKWLRFRARYDTKEPYDFMINNIDIPDSYELIKTTTESGRQKIYLKNHNPYVRIDSLEMYVDPNIIVKTNTVGVKYWSIVTNITYSPGIKLINFNTGIYAPFGLGVVGGLNRIPKDIKNNYFIGLGWIKTL